jgi:hypothetical protein
MKLELFVLTLSVGLGTTASAEDICSALDRATGQLVETHQAAQRSVLTISDLREGLDKVPDVFGADADAVEGPEEAVREASRQLMAALRALEEHRAERCPDVPN